MISNVRERQYGGYAWDGGWFAGAWKAITFQWRPPGSERPLDLRPGLVNVLLNKNREVATILCSCPCGCGKLVNVNPPRFPESVGVGYQGEITIHRSSVGCNFCFRFDQGLVVRT